MKRKKIEKAIMDYVKASRRAARNQEIEAHGKAVSFQSYVRKSKKAYDRKLIKRADMRCCPDEND